MSNGQFNMESSQPDRLPREPGPVTEVSFLDNGFPWTHVPVGGDATGVVQLVFYDVPMIDPANIIGEEGLEVVIELSVNLNLLTQPGDPASDTGVDVDLFNTPIVRNLWRSNAQEPLPTHGRACPGTFDPDVYIIRISAETFFNARQEWVNIPGGTEDIVVFSIFVITPRWAGCGSIISDPPYSESLVRISKFSFTYQVFGPDVPLPLKMWGEDLCHNMVMIPTFRGGEHFPYLLSTHSTRAMARLPSPTEEVCRHHQGEVVIDKDGFARGFYCGKSLAAGDPVDHQRNYYSDAYIVQEGDDVLSGQVPKGFACFLGSYHAPRWTEAQLWSHRNLCNWIE